MSDTPETDAEMMQDEWDHADTDFGPFAPSIMVSAEFARGLERERDEAREKIEDVRKVLRCRIHEGPILAALRVIEERDEAREQLRIAVGLLSTQPQFADKHPEDVLAFVKEGAK